MAKTLLFCLFFIAAIMTNAQKTGLKYLALGDSYTIGESVAENERWPNQLADSLSHYGRNTPWPTIIATTGWRTDDLSKAMEAARLKNEYNLVSLLIGVNNQYQGKSVDQYATEFEDLLHRAVELAQGNKKNVFVVSIPDYGFTPFGKAKQQEISTAIDAFNEVNKRITLKEGIAYVNITDISRHGFDDPGLIAPDGLHPSGRMYGLWVARILEMIGH